VFSNAIIAPWRSASPRSASMKLAVDDPGRGREQRSLGDQPGFERPRFRPAEPDEVHDALRFGLGLDRGKLARFLFACRHEQLAAALVRNTVVAAKIVQHRLAVDAQPSLVEAGRVIDAGVYHLTVARADARTDCGFALNDNHLAPRASECSGCGQAEGSGADYEAVNPLHV
jgi:hypothetical protein